jgi:hypothetical protein
MPDFCEDKWSLDFCCWLMAMSEDWLKDRHGQIFLNEIEQLAPWSYQSATTWS